MARYKENNKAKLMMEESITEICKRTGIPAEAVFRTLWTYNELVKECVEVGVEVVFCDIGTFTYQHFKGKKDFQCRNPKTGETFLKDFPECYKPLFRFNRKFNKTIKENTALLLEEEKEN